MDVAAAYKLGREMMDQHGFQNVPLIISSGKKQLGLASYKRNSVTGKMEPSSLKFSRYLILLNDEIQVRQTIAHEIAHFCCIGHNHDWIWRSKAIELGATGERCNSTAVMPEGRYLELAQSVDINILNTVMENMY
jgi:hypothetical protein